MRFPFFDVRNIYRYLTLLGAITMVIDKIKSTWGPPEIVTGHNTGNWGLYSISLIIMCVLFNNIYIPHKCREMESMVYRLYPGKLESLTILQMCDYKDNTFAWVLVWQILTHNLPHSSLMLNELSQEIPDEGKLCGFLWCIHLEL